MASVTLISVNDVVYELGVRMIKAVLRERGHQVNLVFINEEPDFLSDDALAPLIELTANSDLIGISLLSHSHPKAVLVTDYLRRHHPDKPVVWGGIHATSFPDECMQYVDYVILGEGEYPLAELAEAIEAGLPFDNIENLCLRNPDGSAKKNPARPPITDLDALPFMDYSMDDEYVIEAAALVPMTPELIRDRSLGLNFDVVERLLVVMSARGCPFQCSFCCNDVWHKLYGAKGGRVRKRSIHNFIEELVQLTTQLPFYSGVVIEDDSFLCRDLDEIREFAALYKERVGLPFVMMMHPSEVDVEKLVALRDAGLAVVQIGLQSGSDEVRRKFYRRVTSEQKVLETNRILSDLGILHKFDVILDTPFEGDAKASLELVRKFRGPFALSLFSLRVYPGLALYDLIKQAGYHDWLAANDLGDSYYSIKSTEPYSFALRRYVTLPPTWQAKVVQKVVSSWPPGIYWMYRNLGGRGLFRLYGYIRSGYRAIVSALNPMESPERATE